MPRFRPVLDALRSGDWVTVARIRGYSLLFLALSTAAVAGLWASADGLLDAWGRPLGTDFANPYAAGRMALEGRAAAIYDYRLHAGVQQALIGGGPGQPFYGWHYPPLFLLLAAPLALLPYAAAFWLWMGTSFAAYLLAIRAILPQRLALLAAAGFPAVYVVVGHGQNAFLTAALLGGGLHLLTKRPWLAGVLIGCLAYKPHLGLVLPLVLIAGGHWRAVGGAALTVLALSLLTLLLWGPEPWWAFLESGRLTRTVVLEQVATGWYRIQSLFATLRGFGAPLAAAYAAQALLTLAVLAALAWMWRRCSGAAARAAACTGTLLATPYLLDYDLAALAPAIAFMVAAGIATGFRPWEKSLLAAAWLAPLLARPAAEHLALPLGPLVLVVLFAVILRRVAAQDAAGCAGRPEAQAPQAMSRIS